MNNKYKIFVAWWTWFLWKRIVHKLKLLWLDYVTTSLSMWTDFRDKKQTEKFFEREKPDIVINCAAYVGWIQFWIKHEWELFYNNTLINLNLIEASRKVGIKRFINPISNCSYPNVLEKDFKEDEWWNWELHPSVLVYWFAKKSTWIQSYAYSNQYNMDFINLLIPNMYGPWDHFEEERSHALWALIMKIVNAHNNSSPEVSIWWTWKPIREWLYVDDCVDFLLKSIEISPEINPINIWQWKWISIIDMAKIIKDIVWYKWKLQLDTTKQDGAPYKIMNIEKCRDIFWILPDTTLEKWIEKTIKWYINNFNKND